MPRLARRPAGTGARVALKLGYQAFKPALGNADFTWCAPCSWQMLPISL